MKRWFYVVYVVLATSLFFTLYSVSINALPSFSTFVFSPQNISYDIRAVPFNLSTTQQSKKIEFINYADEIPNWRTLCSSCDSYGLIKQKKQILREGLNDLTIKATDFFGNTDEKNITLFTDTIPPRILSTFPQRSSITNGSNFFIRYTEENMNNISLFIDSNINHLSYLPSCPLGKNQNCSLSINLSAFDGQSAVFYFEVRDSIFNTKSNPTQVLIDTTSPILSVFSPQNISYAKKVSFSITISEPSTLEYLDSSVFPLRWKTLCSSCDSYGFPTQKFITFSPGSHTLTIRARDKAGNSDEETVTFLS